MGRLVAKALQDGHDLDLPLSVPFLKLVLGEPVGLADVAVVTPAAAGTVAWLQAKLRAKEAATDAVQPVDGLAALRSEVDDACLVFALGDLELGAGGSDKAVTLENLEEYLRMVVEAVVVNPAHAQAAAFLDGVSSIMDPTWLRLFSAEEFAGILADAGSSDALWQPDVTLPALRFHSSERHRYSRDSPQVQWLAQVLAELTPAQRRLFLEFTTSSPRMPVEGLCALKPARPQVNRRVPHDPAMSPDDLDVHCRTCTVELELPEYSSIDILRSRLLGAIYSVADGRGGFKKNS